MAVLQNVSETGGVPVQQVDEERFQAGSVATISASHLIHDTYSAFLPPLLPVIIPALGISTTQAGLLQIFYNLPSLVQPLIGYLGERAGLRYFMILAPALTAAAMSLVATAGKFELVSLLLLLAGISSAALHSIGPVIIANISGRLMIGRGMSFWMVGGEIGRALGPVLVVAGLSIFTLQHFSWMMVVGFAASIGLYLIMRKTPDRTPVNNQQKVEWRGAWLGMRSVILPLTGMMAARGLMQSAVTTFLPLMLKGEGADLAYAGISLSIMQAAGILGAFAGGSFSDRIGRRRMLAMSYIFSSGFLFLFLNSSGWAQIPALLGMGLAMLSIMPVMMAVVQENCPDHRALANGVFLAVAFIIQSISALVAGWLGDTVGLRYAFTLGAGLVLFGLPFLYWLPGKRR